MVGGHSRRRCIPKGGFSCQKRLVEWLCPGGPGGPHSQWCLLAVAPPWSWLHETPRDTISGGPILPRALCCFSTLRLPSETMPMSPDGALSALLEGNQRFLQVPSTHSSQFRQASSALFGYLRGEAICSAGRVDPARARLSAPTPRLPPRSMSTQGESSRCVPNMDRLQDLTSAQAPPVAILVRSLSRARGH